MSNLSEHTLHAIKTAKKAACILLDGFDKRYKISSKDGVHNLVTEYDLKSEKEIISSIKKKYPDHNILSEEKGSLGSSENDIRWIIDPLDGTVNFAHHIPVFCVNIAIEKNSEIFSAVTYYPIADELFVAEKNKGAFLNDTKIAVSHTDKIENAILSTGFPYDVKNNPKNCIGKFSQILNIGLPIRRLGSAALDLAYVAAGRFDGFWELNLGAWDIAPGILLIEEAGGKITDWNGNKLKKPIKPIGNEIVVSNAKIHESLIENLKE